MPRFLIVGVLLGCHPLVASQIRTLEPPPTPQSMRPSFVILLCDDLGYGDLACFGHPTIRTPNLDRLASQGMKLTACYAGMPVCSPSRAALMTGRVCQREDIHDWIPANSGIQLKRSAVTVAELLKAAGYATCMAGKWHLNSKFDGVETTPGDHGFDHWLATQNNAGPSHLNATNFVRSGMPVGRTQGHSSEVIVAEVVKWLEGLKPDQPFFAFLPFHAPHEPVAADEKYLQLYPGIENDRAAYFATVTQTDEAIGRLLGALDATKRSDNTLVFFSSDNGPDARWCQLHAGFSWPSHSPQATAVLAIRPGDRPDEVRPARSRLETAGRRRAEQDRAVSSSQRSARDA